MIRQKTTKTPSVPAKSRLFSRRGVVLIAVLLVSVLLALAAYQYTDVMTAEYKATENAVRAAQARSAAESGVHYVMALLSDPNTLQALNNNIWDNPQYFQDQVVRQEDNARYTFKFSVMSPPDMGLNNSNNLPPRFGVVDEGGKINPNALMKLDPSGNTLYKMLMLLPNMTSDIACAIIDWIDADDNPYMAPDGSASGAESSYYTSLNPPYRCKNAPLDSIEELLWVRGVTPLLLFGSDKNRNGDPSQIGADGTFDPGWASYLTLYSREMNVASDGTPRVSIAANANSDLTSLYNNLMTAIGDQDMATFIVLYLQYGPYTPPASSTTTNSSNSKTTTTTNNTGATTKTTTTTTTTTQSNTSGGTMAKNTSGLNQNSLNLSTTKSSSKINSLYDLINTYVSVPSSDPKGQPTIYPSPLNDPGQLATLLPVLLDKVTTSNNQQIVGRINVNTAPQAVLKSLQGIAPELTDDIITAIINARPSLSGYQPDPTYNTPAWLLTNNAIGLKPTAMSKLDKYITTTTQVYRFQVVAFADGGGPMVRMEAVIDTNGGNPRIMYQRDMTELGKGFDPQQNQQ
jgi:type II secretory pathway component PulK